MEGGGHRVELATAQAILSECEELQALAAREDYTLECCTQGLLGKLKGAVAACQPMLMKKEMQFSLKIPIREDLSVGGAAIAEFERDHMAEPPAERVLEMTLTLPCGYPDEAVCIVVCASPESFRDAETAARFNKELSDYLSSFVGATAMLFAVEFCVDNVATAFHRLYAAVYLMISIDGGEPRRLEIEVSRRLCPRTAENFRALCTGESGASKEGCSKKLCYKGCSFYRIVPGQFLHSGDFTRGGLYGGSGSESIYGGVFADETFTLKHDRPFVVSMANAGPNSNGSQFFITRKALPSLDGKYVCFGIVRSGAEELVPDMEEHGVGNGKVKVPIVITDCGEIKEPYTWQHIDGGDDSV